MSITRIAREHLEAEAAAAIEVEGDGSPLLVIVKVVGIGRIHVQSTRRGIVGRRLCPRPDIVRVIVIDAARGELEIGGGLAERIRSSIIAGAADHRHAVLIDVVSEQRALWFISAGILARLVISHWRVWAAW